MMIYQSSKLIEKVALAVFLAALATGCNKGGFAVSTGLSSQDSEMQHNELNIANSPAGLADRLDCDIKVQTRIIPENPVKGDIVTVVATITNNGPGEVVPGTGSRIITQAFMYPLKIGANLSKQAVEIQSRLAVGESIEIRLPDFYTVGKGDFLFVWPMPIIKGCKKIDHGYIHGVPYEATIFPVIYQPEPKKPESFLNISCPTAVPAGSTATCQATASNIVSGEWFVNGNLTARCSNQTSCTWTQVPAGNYVVQAVGKDASGATVNSNSVSASVK